ncbi:MAG: hypothetical protein AAB198_05305 [Actinomycetota bacterium]
MDDVSRTLRDVFVAAYRPYLTELLLARGWPVVSEAIAVGEADLGTALDALLSLHYREQRRAPLELFQEAMIAPNDALAAAGVEAPVRDSIAEAALPGDMYDLAPASSAVLGDDAWRAHLAWGVAKAAAITRPAVALLSSNLLDVDRIEHAVQPLGFRVEKIGSLDGIHDQAAVFVDLEHASADAVIERAAVLGKKVVAFGPHVDDLAFMRARSLGAAEAVPRSRFFSDPGSFLPQYA